MTLKCQLSPHSLQIGCGLTSLFADEETEAKVGEVPCLQSWFTSELRQTQTLLVYPSALS